MSRFLVDHVNEINMSVAEVAQRHQNESDRSSLKSEVLVMLVTMTGKRLEKLYKIHNDVWKEQPMELTPEFPRAVYTENILPEIDKARDFGNAILRKIPFKYAALFNLPFDYTEADWREAQDWLRSTWRQKVEVDAEEIRHWLATRRSRSRRVRPPGKRRWETTTLKKRKKPRRARSRAGTTLIPHPLDSRPNIAKRRAIVRQNLNLSAAKLCKRFDDEGVPLPEGWDVKHDVKQWWPAYLKSECRPLIFKLISVDKRKVR
jgi:hypothetical protein